MKNILVTVLVLVLFSCDNYKEECCQNIEADLQISITNSEGKDLLNPLSGEINMNNFKLYYKNKSGNLILFDKPNLDNSRGFKLVSPEGSGLQFYTIILALNTEYLENNTSLNIISWSKEKKHEIKTLFSKENNNLIAENIYIDNKLVIKVGEKRFTTIIDL